VDTLPEGTFGQPEELLSDLPRKVLQTIEPNEPILREYVTEPGGRATLSAMIEPDYRAVTIPVNEIAGVAGFVKPENRVDVILTTASEGGAATRVLLQNMKVLAADQTATTDSEEPQVAGTVTLEADPVQAKKLILAQQVGTIALVLRSGQDESILADRALTIGQLFAGNDQPTKVESSPTPIDPLASVNVYRGLNSSITSVPKE